MPVRSDVTLLSKALVIETAAAGPVDQVVLVLGADADPGAELVGLTALGLCDQLGLNCGTGAFKVSRLRRAINEGRWDDAAELLRKPNTAGGVVYRGLDRRRQAERALFLLGY